MNGLLTKGFVEKVAQLCLDLGKLTFAAAFITPYFASNVVDDSIIWGLIISTFVLFAIGLMLYRWLDEWNLR